MCLPAQRASLRPIVAIHRKEQTMTEERPEAQRAWHSRELTRTEMPEKPFDLDGVELEFVEVLPPASGGRGGICVVHFRIKSTRALK
jgi:hypothetical protein